jgi:hypothetical protein
MKNKVAPHLLSFISLSVGVVILSRYKIINEKYVVPSIINFGVYSILLSSRKDE